MRCTPTLLSVLLLPCILSATAHAQLAFVQPNVLAEYELVFDPGTPFNDDQVPLLLPFSALGDVNIAVNLDDFSLTDATGEFEGVLPAGLPLPEGTPFTLRAFELVSGQLSNIQVDGGGAIAFADVEFSLLFDQIIDPDGANLRIFASDPLTFTGTIDSVPFSVGTSFSGPAPSPIFQDDGTTTGVEIGDVQNRFLTVVPEPTSAALLLIAGLVTRGRVQRG